jgi:hypothetical protein
MHHSVNSLRSLKISCKSKFLFDHLFYCLIFISLRGTIQMEEFYKYQNSLKLMMDKIQTSYDFNFKVFYNFIHLD